MHAIKLNIIHNLFTSISGLIMSLSGWRTDLGAIEKVSHLLIKSELFGDTRLRLMQACDIFALFANEDVYGDRQDAPHAHRTPIIVPLFMFTHFILFNLSS